MARNRVIYQSEALYVSDGVDSVGTGQHYQLSRVQSANMSYDLAGSRQDINQFGQLARIDAVVSDTPSVSLDFTYYLTNGWNENVLGFWVRNDAEGITTDRQFASGHLVSNSGRNFFLLTSEEGTDLNLLLDSAYTAFESGYGYSGTANDLQYVGIGNGFLSDYTLDGAVGDFPTASVTIEGLNANAGINAYTAGAWGKRTDTLGLAPYNKAGAGNALPSAWGGYSAALQNGASGYYTGIFGIENPAINPADGTKLTVTVDANHLSDGVVLPRAIEMTSATDFGNVDNEVTALRPGDITLDISEFDGFGGTGTIDGPFARVSGADGICIQNFSLSVPLSRTPINCLGTKFAKARVVDFPAQTQLTVSALVNELSSGNLADVLEVADNEHTIILTINEPSTAIPAVRYEMRKAVFDAESFSASIGPNKTVDLTFTSQIGGVNDTGAGVFMSGSW